VESGGLVLIQKAAGGDTPHKETPLKVRDFTEPDGKVKEGGGLVSLFREIFDARASHKGGAKGGIPFPEGGKKEGEFSEDVLSLLAGGKKGRVQLPPRALKIPFPKPEKTEGIGKKTKPVATGAAEEETAKNNTSILALPDKKNILSLVRPESDADIPTVSGKEIREKEDTPAFIPGTPESRGKKDPAVTVIDLRTGKVTPDRAETGIRESKGGQENTGNFGGRRESGDPLILVKGDGNAPQSPAEPARPAQVGDFSGQLDKLLKGDLGKEIVKQTGIVVKDDGKGEIRLVLQPERLGKVRIRLELDDNHIAAKILVENKSIREVFEHNLEHLARTFREGGFSADSLDVSVQGDGAGRDGRKQQGPVQKKLAGELEAMVPLVQDEIREETTVNMVV